ncbi:interferon alpha/beta receptor 2 [Austrofundulus limnaeus]|uniref:Interferon alpha/beta receptor 2 n=1 Tax=Austrofundulus limnaeus TaxID=52670 RepID=A0A2I4CMP0_AUSLI|nr:PREDICTED: interferon alpha/beta receptor 2-like [Austrofundulus limnaeus]
MTGFPLLVLVLLLQLGSALWSLPAPVNLTVSSLNFQHVLRWDPGPGSPPGTRYRIFRGLNRGKMKHFHKSTGETWFRVKLDPLKHHHLTVQAFFNNTTSPQSSSIIFSPSADTTIGPPVFSLAGCGTCIQGNISLPFPDRKQFDPSFMVWWRKEKNDKEDHLETRNRSFILTNLERGAKFCVRIKIKTRLNPNTLLSNWSCTFSSPEEPDTEMLLTGVVSALLVFVPVVLTMVLLCLRYTGFICKRRKARPQALMFLMKGSAGHVTSHQPLPVVVPSRAVRHLVRRSERVQKGIVARFRKFRASVKAAPLRFCAADEPKRRLYRID